MEKLTAQVYDLVVTDLRLPKVDGLTVFRKTRALSPGTDVILMTSFGAVADAVAALKEGAYDYLTKPFEIDDLAARVRAIADKRGLTRQLEASPPFACPRGRSRRRFADPS